WPHRIGARGARLSHECADFAGSTEGYEWRFAPVLSTSLSRDCAVLAGSRRARCRSLASTGHLGRPGSESSLPRTGQRPVGLYHGNQDRSRPRPLRAHTGRGAFCRERFGCCLNEFPIASITRQQENRMATVTLKVNPFSVAGTLPSKGPSAPDF